MLLVVVRTGIVVVRIACPLALVAHHRSGWVHRHDGSHKVWCVVPLLVTRSEVDTCLYYLVEVVLGRKACRELLPLTHLVLRVLLVVADAARIDKLVGTAREREVVALLYSNVVKTLLPPVGIHLVCALERRLVAVVGIACVKHLLVFLRASHLLLIQCLQTYGCRSVELGLALLALLGCDEHNAV